MESLLEFGPMNRWFLVLFLFALYYVGRTEN